jgi:predicted nucleic-acid-binding Zn-ribbon protein
VSSSPRLATLGIDRRPFYCRVCDGAQFVDRKVKLNTTAAELFNVGWANESAIGLVCQQCGYLHMFVGRTPELWTPSEGYPAPA